MDYVPSNEDQVNTWEEIQLVYNAALKEMETRLEVLSKEFALANKYNPIEHVTSRIKSSESIVKKLEKNGYEPNFSNMVEHLNDIAGVRVICSFTSDIYRIADIISAQNDLEVMVVKDYYKKPKPSGYQSYHMILKVPVYLSERVLMVKIEMQIRTVAMDFWATLEHKIRYKLAGGVPEHIQESLVECARMVAALDDEMLCLNEEVTRIIGMGDK